MAYGDYDGPDKPDKGKEGGSCNRTRCQASPAIWWNHGSRSWYCQECRNEIQFDEFNHRDWRVNFQPKYGHPMFETRGMMIERQNKENAQSTTPCSECEGDGAIAGVECCICDGKGRLTAEEATQFYNERSQDEGEAQ